METQSEKRASSSRRKGMPLKVKLSLGGSSGGGPKVKVNGDRDNDADTIDVESLSSDEDSSDLSELPEGTVVVQPEPVDEKKICFKGPEFKSSVNSGSKKGPGGSTTVLENVFCTACGKQVNPWKSGVIKKHKELRVLICRKCHNFLGSGAIATDEDGFDEQCRWCGEGGRLTVCDNCPRAFCKACILRNFGRAAFTAVTESENWECYCCDPAPLDELRKQCRTVKEAVKSDGKKPSKSSDSLPGKSSSSSTRRAAPSSSAASIQSEFPDNPAALLSSLITNVDFGEDNVVSVASNLLNATGTLRHALLTIINMVGQSQGVESCLDESHVQPLFTLPSNMSVSQKRQKCAKVLSQSVHTFMGSVCKLLNGTKRGQTSSASKSSSKTLVKSECNGSSSGRAKQGTKATDLTSSTLSISLTSCSSISSTTKSKETQKSRRAEAQSPAKREGELTKKDSRKETVGHDKGKEDIDDCKEESDGKEVMEESMDFTEHGFLDDRTGQLDNGQTSDGQPLGKKGDLEGAEASTSLEQYSEGSGVKQEAVDDKLDKKSVSKKGATSSLATDYLGTPFIQTTHSSQSQDDMSQQEENLFAKLELIQELAEEFCKGSAKAEQSDNDSKLEVDSNSSDFYLPEVSFGGAVDPASDKNRDSHEPPIKSVRGKLDKKSRGKDKGSSDLSDISDLDSYQGRPEVEVKPEKDVKSAASVRKKVDDAGDSQSMVDSGDDHDNFCDGVSSSDLILSSGSDDGQQRRRRKKKNGLSQKKKPAAVKSNSDKAEWRPGGKSKRRLKTTHKESYRRLGANHQPIDIRSENEDGDESESDSEVEANGKTPKSKTKTAGKVTSKSKDSDEDSDGSGAGAKTEQGKSDKSDSVKDSSEGGVKNTTKEQQKKDVDSSEEDEKLKKEVDNLLSGAALLARKTKKSKDTDEEEDVKPDKKAEKMKAESDKLAKGRKGGQKKTSDSSDSVDEKDDEDDFEDEDSDDDFKIESTDKKSKKLLDKKNSDVENDMAKSALLDDLDEDDEDEDDDEKDDDDSSSESDVGAVQKRKSARQTISEDKAENDGFDEGDSDFEPAGARKRFRSKLLDAKVSESDSEEDIVRKKKTISKKRKRTSDDEDSLTKNGSSDADSDDGGDSVVDSEVDNGSDEVSDDSTPGKKKNGTKGKGKGKGKGKEKRKKRRRIKKIKDSSEEGEAGGAGEEEDDPGSRKKIRKIKSDKRLGDDTKAAARAEEERRKRVAEKQKRFNGVETKEVGDGQAPITTKLVLEADEKTGEPIIQVNPRLICKLKPHQVEAVQFMWDCMFESLERAKKEEGSGCILAHCMGLGKTLSVITFVHTVLTHAKKTKMKTCLIVCPLNTVLNWLNEWEIWLDEKDQLTVYEMAGIKQNWARADALEDWHNNGGIMIMGYEMLRNLSQGSRVRNKKQKAIFAKSLLDPGPDMIICDEGHIMKNAASALSKAMTMIRTRRRVVLTGTPLQNNLIEYHCMVDFVKHNLLGTRKEFANRFVNPITNGQHSDSTQRDVRIMKARAHILHELLAGCVQRRDYSALTKFLPPKQEYVISVRLSPMQMQLYEEYLNRTGQVDGQITTRGAQLFKDYQNLMKIWTHPWVLKLAEIRDELKMKYDDEDSFIDDSDYDSEKSFGSSSSSSSEESMPKMSDGEEESAGEGTSAGQRSRRLRGRNKSDDKDEIVKEWKTRSRGGEYEDLPVEDTGPQAVSNEWWAHYIKEEDQNKMELGGKLVLLFDILRMSEEIGDKVLIFSQSLLSLDIIEYFLEQVDSKFQADTEHKEDSELKEEFGKRWTKGEDYFRLDGSTSAQLRQHWASVFNDPENHRARLFVISTRAGGLGINLVGANRVIIFDASWNPSHDVQSIFRVYRFGQTKPCYIYRFLAQGTMEEKIYDRQVTKLSLSQRVVDEHQIERHFTAADLHELYTFRPQRLTEEDRPTPMLPKDVLLAEIMSGENKDWFVSTHEHDSLLENLVEQELTEEEKKAAWEDYENEKKGLRMNMPQIYGGQGLGNFLSQEYLLQTARNLREQHPDMPQEVLQAHLQRIIMMQIRQKQEEQRRLELMQRQQEVQMAQMMQHNAMLQAQYMHSAGAMGAFPGLIPPGTRFSPSLYAHMAQPGLSAYHSAIPNIGGTLPTSSSASSLMASLSQKETAKPKAQEVINLDESN